MKVERRGYLVFMLFATITNASSGESNNEPWTWLYVKTFIDQEVQQHADKRELFFSKEEVPAFTQLLFTWNAVRPDQGYFSFFGQVRDAKTKEWGPWHKMMEWGKNIQRSFVQTTNQLSSYYFVRLEVEKQKCADAFRVRITTAEDASLANLKAFCVSLFNFSFF